MQGLVFISLLLALLLFVGYLHTTQAIPSILNDTKEGFQPLATPQPGPPPQPIGAGEKAEPYAPPTASLPSSTFGDMPEVGSRPFQDPVNDKGTYAQVYSLQQDMRGFNAFELEKLGDSSDPAIQLPLSNFQADLQRLDDDVSFLNRNPGLPSTLSVKELNEIRVNLSYLQKKARILKDGVIEGFATDDKPEAATLNNLQTALNATNAEIARLSSSGTTDPTYMARISTLTQIKQKLTDLINQLKNNKLLPSDVPITKKDLTQFLPTISDSSQPLDRFLKSFNAPESLTNLFPTYSSGDSSGATAASALLEKYADKIVNILASNPNALNDTSTGQENKPRGAFDQAIQQIQGGSGSNLTEKNSGPDHFNWKDRSTSICNAIKSRGLDPADFACLDNTSKVGTNFSWRGYARMICSRLGTTLDPGLPEVCGCPPIEWAGWRQ